jgi:hypothetical protein
MRRGDRDRTETKQEFQVSEDKNIVLYKKIILYSRPSSFTVLLIRGKFVVIFEHRGVGPSIFRGCSCAGARSNTQHPACARLSQ